MFSGRLGQLRKIRGAYSGAIRGLEMGSSCLNQKQIRHGAVLSTLTSQFKLLTAPTFVAADFVHIFAFRPPRATCGALAQWDFDWDLTDGLAVLIWKPFMRYSVWSTNYLVIVTECIDAKHCDRLNRQPVKQKALSSLKPVKSLSGDCGQDQFQCLSSRECLQMNQTCDGYTDCDDKSDEDPRKGKIKYAVQYDASFSSRLKKQVAMTSVKVIGAPVTAPLRPWDQYALVRSVKSWLTIWQTVLQRRTLHSNIYCRDCYPRRCLRTCFRNARCRPGCNLPHCHLEIFPSEGDLKEQCNQHGGK